MTVAVEAAKQGITVGEDTVSGLMFADDFVGISETPEGLHKQIERAFLIEYKRKWRVTANVKKCAVVACNEDKENRELSNESGEKMNYRLQTSTCTRTLA